MKRDDFKISGSYPFPGTETTQKLGFWGTGSDEYRLTGEPRKWDPLKVHEVKLDKMGKTKFLYPYHYLYEMWVNAYNAITNFQADICISDNEGNKLAFKQGDEWTINDAEKAIEVLLKEINELKKK